MPRLSQWLVRVAMLYLILGFTVGGVMLANKGLGFNPLLWRLLPAHIEFLLFGWVVQLTMGVGFWILPRFWQKPSRPKPVLVQLAFVLLNLGIWLVVAAGLFGSGGGYLLAGRALQAAAVLSFALHAGRRTVSRQG